ncbi:MAG: hypothetical protein QM713_05910 [Arachnia sp.]
MRNRWVSRLGWLECVVAGLLLSASIAGLVRGVAPPGRVLWDALTTLCVAVTLRYPRLGVGLLIAASFLGLLVDPASDGMSHYIAICGLVMVIRRGRIPLAVVGTVMLGGVLVVTSYRRAGGHFWYVALSIGIVYLIAWAVGWGVRSIAKAEAARVEARHRDRQLAVAADLHDFVARNLTALVMAAEAFPERMDESAAVEIAERARLANASLRAITAVMRGEGEGRRPAIGAEEALAQGIEAIEAQGGAVQVESGTKALLRALPEEADLVLGRILGEALHNALKHGDLSDPVVVVAEESEQHVDLVVTNRIGHRADPGEPTMGLLAMAQHAEVLGGRAESMSQGGTWVCTASLPLRMGREER